MKPCLRRRLTHLRTVSLALSVFLLLIQGCTIQKKKSGLSFSITCSDSLGEGPYTGRMLLLLSDNKDAEPRFQINDGPGSQLIFGKNVNLLRPGDEVIMDEMEPGYPLESIEDIPPGDYYVQALLHKYETFYLENKHQVKLPVDHGEGQHWNRSPGNIYSTPVKVHINPDSAAAISILIDREIDSIPPPQDTKYIKHVRMQSDLLSGFWGRPVFLQANVLLPEGFDRDAEARYPLMVFHGHFPYTFSGFRTSPPDADPNDSIYNARFRIYGYNYIQQKEAYDFYKKWTGPEFPRYLVIEIQHQNPYYDDSYAVNSANLGPYGDAITYELIPYVENMFHGVGEGWGRFLYGGSTGGWEALAVQVFYPGEYNGCFAACPDPVDFRAYTVINIYKDKNAYFLESPYKKIFRPGQRDYRGHISSTIYDMNRLELVLGDNSRSGGQWDIWQAVYSPQGTNGYPVPIWDKMTGVIDHDVAAYWKEHYDLRYIMQRDWATLGKKLKGKIHIYCGDMDTYYLNNAVALTKDFLEHTTDPYYDGEVVFGNGFEHCWNGDPDQPNYISRLRYNTMYLPKIRERLKKTAPKNNRLVNWGL